MTMSATHDDIKVQNPTGPGPTLLDCPDPATGTPESSGPNGACDGAVCLNSVRVLGQTDNWETGRHTGLKH